MLVGAQPDFTDGAKDIPGFTGKFGRIAGAKAEQGNSRHRKLLKKTTWKQKVKSKT